MKRLVVVVCAAMLLAGCSYEPMTAERSEQMTKYLEICEQSGGKSEFNEMNGTVKCKWNLNKEES